MSESGPNPFESPEKEPAQSAQEILKLEIDKVLDEYFLLLSRRGLEKDENDLYKDIDEKRQELVDLTQKLDGQIESDELFSNKLDTQLDLAEKGIEIGKEKLDGKDNIEDIMTNMRAYGEELKKLDIALNNIKGTIEKKDEEKEELETLIFELKTMINSFIKIGEEIQRLITSLDVDNKQELVQRQVSTMNRAFHFIAGIQDTDKTIENKDKLNNLKTHFYKHFDETMHFYEELRDLKNK